MAPMRPQFRGCIRCVVAHQSAIVFLNGFRQGAGPGEGLWRLYQTCCNNWFDRRSDLVIYRTWDSNHEETADLIDACKPQYITLAGYSYGCGWGCTQLAGHLADRRHLIDDLFLIDPVPRYKFLPAKVKSLTRGGHYRVPVNVHNVHAWRQVNKRGPFDPVGHRIELGTTATHVSTDRILGTEANLHQHGETVQWPASSAGPGTTSQWLIDYTVNHGNIDDHQKIHEYIVARVALLAKPPQQGDQP